MTQLALLPLTDAAGGNTTGNAGIWGWVGSDGTEYALPTTMQPGGVAVVSLKDPKNPKQLFYLGSPNGVFHELLTVGNHLYKCADQGDAGVQIWDLSPLPEAPAELAAWKGVPNCHSLWSDSTGTPPRLYVEGQNDIKVLSLANPAAPVQVGLLRTQVHDGFGRGNRLYVATGGGRALDIWDAADPAAPLRLGRAEVGAVSQSLGEPLGFSHNVWVSDDAKLAFTTEETNGCTVKAWDIADETDPKFAGGTYLADTVGKTMAHNVYVRRHLLYVSHYGLGIRVLDFKDPARLVEVAFHNPGGSSWGCYPWLPSGLILHGNGGLRVVEPDPDIRIRGGNSSVPPGGPQQRFAIAPWGRGSIRFHLPGSGPYGLTLSAWTGQEVFRFRGHGPAGPQILALDPLASGSYQVRLSQGPRRFHGVIRLTR